MKKAEPQHLSKYAPSVHLYREDLDAIFEILRAASKEVSIYSEGYNFDSIDDLCSNSSENVRTLLIESTQPYVRFELEGKTNGTRLFIATVTPASRAIFHQISEILEHRKLPITSVLTPGLGGVLLVVFFGILLFGTTFINSVVPNTALQYAILFSPLVLAFVSFVYGSGGRSVATLTLKGKQTSFWMRNQDKILLMVLSALFGYFISKLTR